MSAAANEGAMLARVLGFAGLIPFVAAAATTVAAANASVLERAAGFGLLAYAATIAAFLGGVHWGPALRDCARGTFALTWGVLPQLLAWVALLLPLRAGLLVAAALLFLCYLVDRRLYPLAGLQAWLPMRRLLTIGAVASCLVGAAGL